MVAVFGSYLPWTASPDQPPTLPWKPFCCDCVCTARSQDAASTAVTRSGPLVLACVPFQGESCLAVSIYYGTHHWRIGGATASTLLSPHATGSAVSLGIRTTAAHYRQVLITHSLFRTNTGEAMAPQGQDLDDQMPNVVTSV